MCRDGVQEYCEQNTVLRYFSSGNDGVKQKCKRNNNQQVLHHDENYVCAYENCDTVIVFFFLFRSTKLVQVCI